MLQNNRQYVLKRMQYQKKKLSANGRYYDDYVTAMDKLIANDYAQRIGSDDLVPENGRAWYLPQHGIYHPTKPNKFRLVFDCSAKFAGKSLNDYLLSGPDLTSSLIGVLTRFRQDHVAFIGDIEAMFNQVRVAAEHHNYLRFFWWPNGDLNGNLDEYCMVTHLFGATSSPSIANFALRKAADEAEKTLGPHVAMVMKQNFYVDDCLKSVQSEDDAIQLVHELREACQKGGFRLTKFSSNKQSVLDSLPKDERSKEVQSRSLNYFDPPSESALGVQWFVNNDTFGFVIKVKDKPFTRRGILSVMSSVYDPLGFASPYIIFAKKILQDLCREKDLGWDDTVPEMYSNRWNEWLAGLKQLEQIQINRCFKPMEFGDVISRQLHIFSDASTLGYGAVAYMRMVDVNGNIHCTFMMGKARLAPLKNTTIPRLELTAATVAVRLGCLIQQELDLKLNRVHYHTDSTTVLHYIFSDVKRFPVFVANRVQLIRDYSSTNQWYYVDTKANPADYASRGLDAKQITQKECWLKGPAFIWTPESTWPDQPILSKDYNIDIEHEVVTAVTLIDDSVTTMSTLIHYYSDWLRLKKGVAIYLKLFQLLRQRSLQIVDPSCNLDITMDDLVVAEKAIMRFVQSLTYPREISALQPTHVEGDKQGRVLKSSSLYRLDPFLSDGILRVGGRLAKANIPEDMKFPIILPYKSHVTTLLIRNIHVRLAHSGRNHVLSELRSKYWVIHANAAVRQYISKCVLCRRLKSPVLEQKMADLPPERSSTEPPFTYTGVDLFGPFVVKQNRKDVKRYGTLFTCLSSRAVHIEIAPSLETDSFINALRRFIARRGPITQIRCDNGTNFVGAERELREALSHMDNGPVKEFLMKYSIQWVFNPPAASHMGGIWERQIRTARKVLSSLSHEYGYKLDDDSFQTLMCEVESIINSRPLTTVSSDPNDVDPLTPNHILTMKSSIVLPPPGNFQRADVYQRKRWRRVQYLANIFWSRWKKEFLATLQNRQKWTKPRRNVQLGDIVFIKDDTLPRNSWSMGRIQNTEPDCKGVVRSATVKTASSELRRPIAKLVLLLPVEEQFHI